MGKKREELVEKLCSKGYIKTRKVKSAMLKVPREEFMPPEVRDYAYLDRPLPIGRGQTISAPHMVAIIAEKLELTRGITVLEIGTGFGYNAAVISEIIGASGHVYTMERIPSLAEKAQEIIEKTGYNKQVTIAIGDGTLGCPLKAPFDRVYGTASAPSIPEPLKKQMKIGGKLIMPLGPPNSFQELVSIQRISEDEFKSEKLGGVAFVPMIGKHGWPED